MLTLYYSPRSCARASHIALEQSGAVYRAERIDFKREQQRSAEYLRLNPKGRVPALATPRGVITETPAILFFVAQSFPQSRLAPLGDPFDLARVQAFNSYLCATVHVAFAHRGRAYRWADEPEAHEAMKRKVPANVRDCFELIEREMLEGPWVLGERYSISDIYLFTLSQWLDDVGIDATSFPKVAQHRAQMLEDPRVQKVIAVETAAAASS